MLNNINVHVDRDTFEPGVFSIQELHWMLEHMQEPPIAAFSEELPVGVIRARVDVALTRFSQLETLKTHKGVAWAGFDAIEDSILRFLSWHERAEEIKRRSRGAIANASMFMWDDTGLPAKYAIGADAGDLVRTEITDGGDRKAFGVKLLGEASAALVADLSDVAPWLKGKSASSPTVRADRLVITENKRMGKVECPVCGKVEEYDTANRQAKSNARARMGKHLKNAKSEVNRHRILYSREYK